MIPDKYNYTNWDEQAPKNNAIWKSGYQPSEIMTSVGSGSTTCGRIVDMLSFDRGAPVTRLGFALRDVEIIATSLDGGWLVNRLDSDELVKEVLTTSEKLDEIREVFGLSISHLSSILRASRPSVHTWLDGKEPRDQTIERINKIYNYSLEWKEFSPYHYSPGRLMRQPLGDGVSMLGLFEAEVLDDGKIKEGFSKLLMLMERQRIRMDKTKEKNIKSNLSREEKDRIQNSLTGTIGSKEV